MRGFDWQAEKAAAEAETVDQNSRHTHFLKYKIALKKNSDDQGLTNNVILRFYLLGVHLCIMRQ